MKHAARLALLESALGQLRIRQREHRREHRAWVADRLQTDIDKAEAEIVSVRRAIEEGAPESDEPETSPSAALRDAIDSQASCKPESFDEIAVADRALDVSALPEFDRAQVFGNPEAFIADPFDRGFEAPQLFVLRADGSAYLVDTQGYQYVRYALRLLPA